MSKYFLQLLLFIIFVSFSIAFPMPVDESEQTFHGSILGSPVVAVFHGPTSIMKDDVALKDTESNPLDKFASLIE